MIECEDYIKSRRDFNPSTLLISRVIFLKKDNLWLFQIFFSSYKFIKQNP